MEKIRTLSLKGIKCKLKKDGWSDDNVVCNIVIKFYRGRKAYGTMETSKQLPIRDLVSHFISDKTETFEMWFKEPIGDIPGIKVIITNLDHETKRSAAFESCGGLNNKAKN